MFAPVPYSACVRVCVCVVRTAYTGVVVVVCIGVVVRTERGVVVVVCWRGSGYFHFLAVAVW